MKYLVKLTLIITAVMIASCVDKKENGTVKTAPVVKLTSDLMTPEVMMKFGRIGSCAVSPDKKKVLYTVSYVNVEANNSRTVINLMNSDGSNKQTLTAADRTETDPQWINGGKQIAFISSESGSSQLWRMDADGSKRRCLSNVKEGVDGYKFSPDGSKVLYVSNIKIGELPSDIHKDLPKTTGRMYNNLMIKHWNAWEDGQVPHPFVAEVKGNKLEGAFDVLEGEPYECPMKPWGGIEQLDWSRDGKTLAYTCRKKTGLSYALSTNSDIYLYDVEKKQTTSNVTEGNMGYDQNPSFSPDGNFLAWESMEHEGWEADKNRLFVMDLRSGEKKDLSATVDFDVSHLSWTNDSQTLLFSASWHGTDQLYKADLNGKVKILTQGKQDYIAVSDAGDKLIASRQSMSAPTEIYSVNPSNGEAVCISKENEAFMNQLTMGNVEERWVETVDKKQMLTWVVYPPHFDKSKKYPTLLYCQGGPQSTVSQFWSYRWNMQVIAARGYIIVMPNRRGVPGFGREWIEEISGDYGGLCMQDYLSAIDDVKKEPYVDADNLGCIGASFGGYSVYWLAGHHEKRFKTFIAHCGMFNFEQQYLETEEMWFVNRDFGGNFWDKNNKVAQKSYQNSPHLFVDKWDTPILVITGEKDFRILASQNMAAYAAAQLRGIPSELLIFPDEGHWVTKPQNALLWHRTFLGWLDKWLKN